MSLFYAHMAVFWLMLVVSICLAIWSGVILGDAAWSGDQRECARGFAIGCVGGVALIVGLVTMFNLQQ